MVGPYAVKLKGKIHMSLLSLIHVQNGKNCFSLISMFTITFFGVKCSFLRKPEQLGPGLPTGISSFARCHLDEATTCPYDFPYIVP